MMRHTNETNDATLTALPNVPHHHAGQAPVRIGSLKGGSVKLAECSCGNHEAHLMASRRTFDGRRVQFWSDGMVTWFGGLHMKGVGRARFACIRKSDVQAAWIVASKVELYEAAEVPALVLEARRAMRLPGVNGRSDVAERNMRRPESERVYREIPLANGTTANIRIR